jgi:hypothetical protein
MRALGPAATSLVVYSAESAVRLRVIWWDDRLDLSKWNRISFFRAPSSLFRGVMPTVAHAAGSPGAFPGRAWERNDGVTTLYPDPDTGGMVHVTPFSARYTAMRFDFMEDYYSAYFPASDHYARLDIVAPYWFLLMLYIPSWLALLLGLRSWRRKKMTAHQTPQRSGVSSAPVAS